MHGEILQRNSSPLNPLDLDMRFSKENIRLVEVQSENEPFVLPFATPNKSGHTSTCANYHEVEFHSAQLHDPSSAHGRIPPEKHPPVKVLQQQLD